MNYRIIFKNLGTVLCIVSVSMLPALIVSLIYAESAYLAFVITIPSVFALGFLLRLIKPASNDIHIREGFAIVALSWVTVSLCGTLPFVISGAIPSFIDALFESVSGFSTTGATILRDIEALPKGILFWRSFTHWIGGLGVLILIIALLPSDKTSSQFILKVESSGPSPEKIVPKLRETAKILYLIYIVLTTVQVIFLSAGGMPIYDALIHAFGTAGTGGFSNRNASVGAYGNAYFEAVITVFMLLFGVSFMIYYRITKKDIKFIFKNEELRFYLLTVLTATVFIAINIGLKVYGNFGESIRYSSFQVVSIITTTGYTTANFNQWPVFSQYILLILMLIGACAGSTAGGIKCIRILLLFKIIKREIVKIIHPRAVYTVKLNKKIVGEEVLSGVTAFFSLYMIIIAAAVLIIAAEGNNLLTSVTAAISTVNNIGVGLGAIGPGGSFADFSIFSKLILSVCMILGRLEIYPLLLLCTPAFWKKVNI